MRKVLLWGVGVIVFGLAMGGGVVFGGAFLQQQKETATANKTATAVAIVTKSWPSTATYQVVWAQTQTAQPTGTPTPIPTFALDEQAKTPDGLLKLTWGTYAPYGEWGVMWEYLHPDIQAHITKDLYTRRMAAIWKDATFLDMTIILPINYAPTWTDVQTNKTYTNVAEVASNKPYQQHGKTIQDKGVSHLVKVGDYWRFFTQISGSDLPPSSSGTLLDFSGSSSKDSPTFEADGDWDIAYNFDCGSRDIYGSTFRVDARVGGGGSTDVSISDERRSAADTSHEHITGIFYLTISSNCSWHVTVKSK